MVHRAVLTWMNGRWIKTAAAGCITLIALTGCGRSKPADDAPFLAALNLNQTILMNVSLQQPVDAQGNLANTNDTGFLALLAHVGVLTATPNPGSAPWWQFAATGASVNNNVLTIPIAKRVITNRAGEQSWSSGGTRYYTEFIVYSIQPVGPFASLPNFIPIYGQLRLTLQKSPSSGQWSIWYGPDRGTSSGTDQDGPRIAHALAGAGTQYEDELLAAIETARSASFNQIEKSFADRGVLERPAASNALVSRNNHLAYYSQPYDLHGGTYVDAERYCESLSALGIRWRLPTLNELHTIVGPDTKLIDVPDGRFWGSIAQANPGQAILLVANTFVVNNGPELTLDMVNPADVNQYGWAQFLQINNDRSTFNYQSTIDVRTVRNDPVRGGDAGYSLRVMCVAPWNGAQVQGSQPAARPHG